MKTQHAHLFRTLIAALLLMLPVQTDHAAFSDRPLTLCSVAALFGYVGYEYHRAQKLVHKESLQKKSSHKKIAAYFRWKHILGGFALVAAIAWNESLPTATTATEQKKSDPKPPTPTHSSPKPYQPTLTPEAPQKSTSSQPQQTVVPNLNTTQVGTMKSYRKPAAATTLDEWWNKGARTRSAFVLLRFKDTHGTEKIILGQESNGSYSPFGGKSDDPREAQKRSFSNPAESPAITASRELHEETGLSKSAAQTYVSRAQAITAVNTNHAGTSRNLVVYYEVTLTYAEATAIIQSFKPNSEIRAITTIDYAVFKKATDTMQGIFSSGRWTISPKSIVDSRGITVPLRDLVYHLGTHTIARRRGKDSATLFSDPLFAA